MPANDPQTPEPQRPARPASKIAGCSIVFTLTSLCALIGGVIGVVAFAGEPPPNEWRVVLLPLAVVLHLIHFSVGAAIGGGVALIAGILVARTNARSAKAPTAPSTKPNE
jgi:hypothetical protein